MIAVVQLDGLGIEPVRRLLGQGELPNLDRLWGETPPRPLSTPADLFPAAVYPTLYSGATPGEHGRFYPFQWQPAEQRVTVADRHPRPTLVFERLATAGLSGLVIDPYECDPFAIPGGRAISGWQLSERVVLRRWSRPMAYWARAALRGGLPPAATEVFGARAEREERLLARRLARSPGRVAGLVERELAGGSYDFAWINFTATHLAGHRLWGGDALEQIHRATDEALGRTLAALPAGARCLVLCPLAMAADATAADLLPEMLARVLGGGGERERDDSDSGAIWGLRAALPSGLRRGVSRLLPPALGRELTARLELRGVDWSRTRAFAHPSDNQGYVRLNVAGRERDGIVAVDETDALCDEIAAGLLEFRDAEGRPLVSDVVRTARHHRGPRADALPDLVVRWDEAAAGSDLAHSERFGAVRRRGVGSGRTGNHPAGGAWVSGLGDDEGVVALEDVAATLAAWADGGPVPAAGPGDQWPSAAALPALSP